MDQNTSESNKRLADRLRKLADSVESCQQKLCYSIGATVPDPSGVLPGGRIVYQRPNLVIVIGDEEFVSKETR